MNTENSIFLISIKCIPQTMALQKDIYDSVVNHKFCNYLIIYI